LLVSDEDGFDGRLLPRSGDDDGLAERDAAAGNRSGEAAEVEMGPVDPLHRQTEGRAAAVLLDLDGFELLQEMPALIPRRLGADRRDIVAKSRRDRDGEQRAEAQGFGEF